MLLVRVCASPAGPHPRAQRVRAVASLGRLDGDRALLGADVTSRPRRGEPAPSDRVGWHVWALAILTASVAWPWLRLRRVPITVERPSGARRDRPPRLRRAAGVLVGGRHQPQPVARVARLRHRDDARAQPATACSSPVPATGPAASSMTRRRTSGCAACRSRRRWPRSRCCTSGSSTSSPAAASGRASGRSWPTASRAARVVDARSRARTYGDALVDEVEAAQPDAVIWDTTQRGKPDSLQLALEAYQRLRRGSVFVVSNKPTTLRLVHGSSAAAFRPSGRSGTPGAQPPARRRVPLACERRAAAGGPWCWRSSSPRRHRPRRSSRRATWRPASPSAPMDAPSW